MKNGITGIVAIGFIIGTLPSAWATDVGMPLYSSDIGKKGNVEVYYEQYKRDIKQDSFSVNDTGKKEESRVIARVNYHASTRASLYVEIGATDSDGSEGQAALLGAGLKIKVYDSEALNVNAFASATYVPEIEYRHNENDGYIERGYSRNDYPDFVQKETYFEINGGLAISKFMQLDEKTTCTPYAGFMVSVLDGDEDYESKYHANKWTGDLKDDGAFSMFAGLGLTLDDTWGIRFEGRFIKQSSFSAGLMYFF